MPFFNFYSSIYYVYSLRHSKGKEHEAIKYLESIHHKFLKYILNLICFTTLRKKNIYIYTNTNVIFTTMSS